jgi:DNA-binding transcriptional ArsR family regulator
MPNYQADLDHVFGALGHEARRSIIARLIRSPASVGELAAPLSMALPSVMQHLQVLQDSGLVTTRKVGRTRVCSIETAGLRVAETWLSGQRSAWEYRLDSLGEHLAATGDLNTNDDNPQPR